ncbi:MAG: GFA family protein [Gammaproteobacteria bacterium]
MIRGSCLCGRVAFELDRVVGPFELCHCPRCRKVSGSAFMAAVGVKAEDFRFVSGEEAIQTCTLPVRDRPPPYSVAFCRHCGSPVPRPPESGWFEIAAGLLDDDPGMVPDKHIYVECKAPWWEPDEGIPGYTAEEIAEYRRARPPGQHPSD